MKKIINTFSSRAAIYTAGFVAAASYVLPVAAHAALTLEPTQQAEINGNFTDLGDFVITQIIALLPVILPVIAVLVLISLGFKLFHRHTGLRK